MNNLRMTSIYSKTSFYNEVAKMWPSIVKETDRPLKKPKDEIERGFEAYENALNNSGIVVLGSEALRENKILIENLGTLATEPQANEKVMRTFLRKINPNLPSPKQAAKQHLTLGAVINDSNWWIFRNDTLMLGALHGQKDFHLVTDREGDIPNSLLWDKEAKRPRVLGRELIMLHLHGYQRIQTPRNYLGIFFAAPTEPKLLTLKECRTAIGNVKDVKQIREIFDRTFRNSPVREPVEEKE